MNILKNLKVKIKITNLFFISMSNLLPQLNRLASIWWLRIILWILLLPILTSPIFFITDIILISLYIFFVLFFSSLFIELLRPGGSLITLGFHIDKNSLKYILFIFLFSLTPFLFILLLIFLNSGKIFFSHIENVNYFINISILLFVFASAEELIFRGVIFQALIEKYNPYLITIIFSLVFSLSHILNEHINLIALTNIFLGGVLLSLLYIKTKSLLVAIAFHFLWNWFQAVLLSLPVSGNYYDIGIIRWELTPNSIFQLFLGNKFGIEEGLITTLVMIIGSLLIMKFFEPSPFIMSKIFKRMYNESKLLLDSK